MSKILYNTIMIFVNTVCVYLLLKMRNDKTYSRRRSWLFLFVSTAMISMIYNCFFTKFRFIPLLTILLYNINSIFFLKNSVYNSTIGVGLFYVISAMGEAICYYIFVYGMGLTPAYIRDTLILNFLTQLMCYTLVIIFLVGEQIAKRKRDDFLDFKKKIVIFIFCILIILTFSLAYWFYDTRENQLIMLMSIFFILTFSLVSIIYILISQRLMQKSEENKELKQYAETIDELSEELRRFKHNHLNLLYGLGGYIESNEWEELKRYYDEIIGDDYNRNQGNNLYSMQQIGNRALFGLLSQKLKEAQNNGVTFTLQVTNRIDDIKMLDHDLCKIVGIYIDNAIEAAMEAEYKNVLMQMNQRDDFTEIIIKNSFKEQPDMRKLFHKKYTTKKGRGRGFGLYFVEKKLKQYKNVLYNTYIMNDSFVQELLIKQC